MSKLRLLFVKEGPASYISNLDLLRTVQRAFPRTELDIRHSQGFHPHPIISIVLPLPVGQSSDCELLDFEVTQETDGAGIAEKLNGGLPEGLTILDCYEARRPVREALCFFLPGWAFGLAWQVGSNTGFSGMTLGFALACAGAAPMVGACLHCLREEGVLSRSTGRALAALALCVPVLLYHDDLPEDALLVPMIDARRMEVYSAVYDRALRAVRPVGADIIDSQSYAEFLADHPVYFFGDGAAKCQDTIVHPNAHFLPDIQPLARNMFPLAEKKMALESYEDVAYFEPFYLKEFVASTPKKLL